MINKNKFAVRAKGMTLNGLRSRLAELGNGGLFEEEAEERYFLTMELAARERRLLSVFKCKNPLEQRNNFSINNEDELHETY